MKPLFQKFNRMGCHLDFWTTQNSLLYVGVQKSAYSASSPTRFQQTLTTTALGMGVLCYFLFWWLKP